MKNLEKKVDELKKKSQVKPRHGQPLPPDPAVGQPATGFQLGNATSRQKAIEKEQEERKAAEKEAEEKKKAAEEEARKKKAAEQEAEEKKKAAEEEARKKKGCRAGS